jgi:hypothetical protein
MKYFIPVFLMLALPLAGTLHAQRFQAGLVAGVNMAQIDGDELAGFNKLGLMGGIKASAKLSDRWQAGIELLFSQQGAARSAKDPFLTVYDNIRFNAVEAPVLITFSEWKLQLSTGLSYSRLINHRIKDISGSDVSDNYSIDSGSLNFLLGGTYYFDPQWGIDVRWTRGLFVRDVRSAVAGGQVDQFLSYFITIRGVYLFQ